MGMSREKKLRGEARAAKTLLDLSQDAHERTSALLQVAYKHLSKAGGELEWYKSVVEEAQRWLANGMLLIPGMKNDN